MNILSALMLVTSLLRSEDFYKLRSVGSVALSPDGSSAAYSVVRNDGVGRPYRELWIARLEGGAESEQFYVALRDMGVEAVFVRYPREGQGLSEPKHVVDLMDRGVLWYEKHFGEKR
jgi:hypothetical protein